MRALAAITVVAVLVLGGCADAARNSDSDTSETAVGDGATVTQEAVPESQLPGDKSWRKARGRADNPQAMAAYADKPSALPGEPVSLHVSTTANSYRVVAYRMGYYGGAEARRVWQSTPLSGEQQNGTGYDDELRMPYATWAASTQLDTGDWPSGSYLLRLVGDNGAEWLVPLVLRDRDASGKLMLVIPDTTLQAYNTWGGRSVYTGPGGFADRSRAVSYSRPYDKDAGSGWYVGLAQPVVRLAEQLDLPTTYVAASDLDTGIATMIGAAGVVMMGHDEYWTTKRRKDTEAARDSGTDLAFLGANTMYWRTRVETGAAGMPQLIVYKDAGEDPVSGKQTTVRFRDQPAGEAERSLIGMDYECYPAKGMYSVVDPEFFLFRGTGVSSGDQLAGIVDIEADRAYPLPGTPANLQIVANNPTDCGGAATISNSTYYTVKSGAGVFATGSIGWVNRALRGFPSGHPLRPPRESTEFVEAVTSTLLTEMAAGPMGAKYPANGNIADFDLPATNTTGSA
jgi:hypothetical protein